MQLNLPFMGPRRNLLLGRSVNPQRVKFMQISLCCVSLFISSLAYAIAPVVDAYDDNDEDAPPTASSTANASNASSEPSAPSSSPSSSPSNMPASAAVAMPSNAASFSLEQRVTILERQIANLNPLLVQMDDLQQQLQGLQGKLESQQHSVKVLEEQVRNQYLAIEKRLGHTGSYSEKPMNTASAPANFNKLTPTPLVDLNTGKKEGANDRKAMTSNAAPTAAAERAYQAAFQLLKGKQYNEAIEAFELFSKKFPSDLNVANADYFLGQLYLLQGQTDPAINYFKRFISRYSQDSRVPDAMLQCGLAYFAKGDKQMAMELFEKIIQQYPDSKAAQAAQARLQQFKAMISAAENTTKHKV